MVNIIDYEDKYHEDFRQLNIVWLEKFNLLESHDVMVLNDPKGTIINNGGHIFLAEAYGKIIGSAGIMKEHDDEYELVKMSVAPEFQGRGISKLLIEKCLEKATQVKAKKLILYSNSQLKTAISLYEKYGFRHVPAVNTPFVTADVKMEIQL
ncbi:MAG: GNAT family N-acetyltransferase [Bacteroidetes bacterium]|nr:GNAT family N-acetyltransferase [Bacteroidota bacterium]